MLQGVYMDKDELNCTECLTTTAEPHCLTVLKNNQRIDGQKAIWKKLEKDDHSHAAVYYLNQIKEYLVESVEIFFNLL